MKKYEEYYVKGCERIDITGCKNRKKLNDCMFNIINGKLKQNFNLISKYPGSYDLRPSVVEYDTVFLDMLREIDIKHVLKSIVLKDLYLFHIQIRVVDASFSYMDWHRDTYFYNNKKSGNFPPGHKIIYYPKFGGEQKERLKFLLGSNKTMFYDRQNDLNLVNYLPNITISDSNDEMFLFDVSSMHGVIPEKNGEKSIRLIYNFLSEEQIMDTLSNDELHMKTLKMYKKLIGESNAK